MAVLRVLPTLGLVGLRLPRRPGAHQLGRGPRGRHSHGRDDHDDHLRGDRGDNLRRHEAGGQPHAADEPRRERLSA